MSLYSYGYRFLIKFLSVFPYKFLYIIGKGLSFLFLVIPNKHKKLSLANLNLVFPETPPNEIRKLLKDSLFHSSMNVLESGMVWMKKNYEIEKDFLIVKNFKSVESSQKNGNGVLLFTPHLGNIEILINFLGKYTNCTIPYTRPKNENLDSIITKSRNDSGVEMVNVDTKGIRQILSTLKNGNVVAFASDQVPKKGSGLFSKFFDREVYSIKLLPKLQQKTNCAVHLMYCERMRKGEGFRIHFSDSICLSKGIQEGVDKMNIEFEKCIMNIPEQYSWEYKKFKRTEQESIYL